MMLIFFVYVFVNIGMVSGILPVVGYRCRWSVTGVRAYRSDGRIWYHYVDSYPSKIVVKERLRGINMRKDWLGIALASALLTACSTDNDQQAPVTQQQPAYNGPVVEIGGAEPQYEPVNPATAQDYTVNGTGYKIVKDPSNFSQTGIATSYGDEKAGNQTATGERFDANAMTAAHPTLPLPSYVRVTNLANGRMIVVRVNDRGLTRRDALSICRGQRLIG